MREGTTPDAARHLGLTLRKDRSGDYRVNFRDGNENTAYYTDSLENAVNTAVEMIRKRTEPPSSAMRFTVLTCRELMQQTKVLS
jgi:hypothetical protein